MSGNQGNKWYNTLVTLGRRKKPFTIEFEASRGISWSGDIAIDSISMTNCQKPAACSNRIPLDEHRYAIRGADVMLKSLYTPD